MSPVVDAISREEFERLPRSRVLIAHEHARRFAVLRLSSNLEPFGLSWHSDLIEPVVVVGSRGDVWAGVDQRVACVSADGQCVVALTVGGSVLDIATFETGTVVLCDAEGTVFNRDHSIRAVRPFFTLPVSVTTVKGNFVVRFDDGHEEVV